MNDEQTTMDKDAEILRLRRTLAEVRALHAKVSKLLSEHYTREVAIHNEEYAGVK